MLELVRALPSLERVRAIRAERARERARWQEPSQWLRRKRRDYEVSRLTEIYTTAIRQVRAGADVSAVVHGLTAAIGSPSPYAPVAIAKADGRGVGAYHCGDISCSGATWEDIESTNDFIQGSGSLQPAYAANDSSLGYRGALTGDGVSHYMSNGIDRPSPGSSETTWVVVGKMLTWASGRRMLGGVLRCGATTDTLAASLGSILGAEVSFTPGTWYRIRVWWVNSASSYCRVGSNQQTGSLGNDNPTGVLCFSGSSPPNNLGHAALANVLCVTGGDLSAGAHAILDQSLVAYYGTVVVG